MDNKPYDQLLIMQYKIESNSQDYDYKSKKLKTYLTETITPIMDQIKMSKYSPNKKYLPLWSWPTRRPHYWRVDIIKHWWHVYSQT